LNFAEIAISSEVAIFLCLILQKQAALSLSTVVEGGKSGHQRAA